MNYDEFLKVAPDLANLYEVVAANIKQAATQDSHILIVGAGGGREIKALSNHTYRHAITAVDPSLDKLRITKNTAEALGMKTDIRFHRGTVQDLPMTPKYDVATSLLVMHSISDDGQKLAFLTEIRDRMQTNGMLFLADICFDSVEDVARYMTLFESHADLIGLDRRVATFEKEAIKTLPIISIKRTHEVLCEAGFSDPTELFHSLWYRCWMVRAA